MIGASFSTVARAVLIPKCGGTMNRPNSGFLRVNGQDVIIARRLWENVPRPTIDKIVGIEREVHRLLDSKGMVQTRSGTNGDADRTDTGDFKQLLIDKKKVSLRANGDQKEFIVKQIFHPAIAKANSRLGSEGLGFSALNSVNTPALVRWEMIEQLTSLLDEEMPGAKIILDID